MAITTVSPSQSCHAGLEFKEKGYYGQLPKGPGERNSENHRTLEPEQTLESEGSAFLFSEREVKT